MIIKDQAGNSTEWQTSEKEEVTMPQAFQEFTLGGNGFVGTFDSVRIWNRALSTDDAELLDLPENKAGLIAHWRMEEGEGQYLYDPIGEHHGVATGSWVNSPRTNQQGQFQFYIDGAKIPRDVDNMEVDGNYPTPSNENQFSVGGYNSSEGKGSLFKGTLEEIRVWNQAPAMKRSPTMPLVV